MSDIGATGMRLGSAPFGCGSVRLRSVRFGANRFGTSAWSPSLGLVGGTEERSKAVEWSRHRAMQGGAARGGSALLVYSDALNRDVDKLASYLSLPVPSRAGPGSQAGQVVSHHQAGYQRATNRATQRATIGSHSTVG